MKGLRPRPTLESSIGSGASLKTPTSIWAQLSDDPRVLHYSDMSVSEWRDLEVELALARRYQDEVRFAAMKNGRTLGMQMAMTGLYEDRRREPHADTLGEHDSKVEASIVRDEVEREERIAAAKAGIAESQRRYAEARANPDSVSEQISGVIFGSRPMGRVEL